MKNSHCFYVTWEYSHASVRSFPLPCFRAFSKGLDNYSGGSPRASPHRLAPLRRRLWDSKICPGIPDFSFLLAAGSSASFISLRKMMFAAPRPPHGNFSRRPGPAQNSAPRSLQHIAIYDPPLIFSNYHRYLGNRCSDITPEQLCPWRMIPCHS
jgi:hypothetical protein